MKKLLLTLALMFAFLICYPQDKVYGEHNNYGSNDVSYEHQLALFYDYQPETVIVIYEDDSDDYCNDYYTWKRLQQWYWHWYWNWGWFSQYPHYYHQNHWGWNNWYGYYTYYNYYGWNNYYSYNYYNYYSYNWNYGWGYNDGYNDGYGCMGTRTQSQHRAAGFARSFCVCARSAGPSAGRLAAVTHPPSRGRHPLHVQPN